MNSTPYAHSLFIKLMFEPSCRGCLHVEWPNVVWLCIILQAFPSFPGAFAAFSLLTLSVKKVEEIRFGFVVKYKVTLRLTFSFLLPLHSVCHEYFIQS